MKTRKILVIEDDRDIARLLELHLHDLNYEVQLAHDGVSGLKQALSKAYDLIILDLMLPGWKDWRSAEACVANPITLPS